MYFLPWVLLWCTAEPVSALLRTFSSGSNIMTVYRTATTHLSYLYPSSFSPNRLQPQSVEIFYTTMCVFCALSLSHSAHRSCKRCLTTPGEASVSLLTFCPLHIVDHSLRVDSKPERTSLWKQPTVSKGINTEPGITLGTVKLAPWNEQHLCKKAIWRRWSRTWEKKGWTTRRKFPRCP